MRNRNFRRTARTSALGTAALLAALSLTACQEDGQAAADTSTPATAAPSEQPSDSTKAPADKGNGKDKGTNGSGADSGSSSGSSSGSADAEPAAKQPKDTGDDSGPVTLACDGGNSKVKLTAVTRPVNHMLLTVTNTGSKACNAYYHPFLRFGEAQAVPRTFEESKPQAVVTLGPGESAYSRRHDRVRRRKRHGRLLHQGTDGQFPGSRRFRLQRPVLGRAAHQGRLRRQHAGRHVLADGPGRRPRVLTAPVTHGWHPRQVPPGAERAVVSGGS